MKHLKALHVLLNESSYYGHGDNGFFIGPTYCSIDLLIADAGKTEQELEKYNYPDNFYEEKAEK